MIKKLLIILFVLGTASLQITQVQAAIISFDPVSQSVNPGDSVSVDLRISNLGDDILTGFDLDLGYDASILGFDSFDFGTGLDVLGFGSFQDVIDFGGGSINVFELSFDFDSDLMALQPDDFVLGTFNFTSLSLGLSSLDISRSLLSGESDDFGFATELQADIQSGSITVTAASVPAPAVIWLFGIGLIGLAGFSKRS